jgi:pyruvate/2-oxoglutarate dehydrogenase complex dihydrolipoamide acyltransferase (E2) component
MALQRALAAVEHARVAYTLTEVRSPIAGRVVSMLVVPGTRVQPGKPLARVVPEGTAPAILAFVPTREAHRVFVGMAADVAVGTAHAAGASPARVTRMPDSDDPSLALPASSAGAAEAFAPVELALLDDSDPGFAAAGARSGERIQVHLHAGDRRWRAKLETWWRG